MTNRYLWTIVSAALCVGASPTVAGAATAPDDYVCATWNGTGECDPITIKASLPDATTELRHLVLGAQFGLNYDGKTYSLQLLSSEWLPAFLGASLKWVEGDELVSAAVCDAKDSQQLPAASKSRSRTAAERQQGANADTAGRPQYSHFETTPIPIHLDEHDFGVPDLHTLYIYPMKHTGDERTHSYCLTFFRKGGGSHDGAVHGDG
jgi:hypothetical protein